MTPDAFSPDDDPMLPALIRLGAGTLLTAAAMGMLVGCLAWWLG